MRHLTVSALVAATLLSGCWEETGSVVAFDLDACPSGWVEFTAGRGRMIVGVNPSDGDGLTAKARGAIGGSETKTLTIENIPPHTHSYDTETGIDGNRSQWQDATYNRVIGQTGPAGGKDGQTMPFDSMPPYTALLYCRKS